MSEHAPTRFRALASRALGSRVPVAAYTFLIWASLEYWVFGASVVHTLVFAALVTALILVTDEWRRRRQRRS